MENDSRNFGGEIVPPAGEGIFSGGEAERFVPENLQSMGEEALKGIDDLPLPETGEGAGNEDIQRVIEGGGVIAASGEADVHTERGVDEMVERAEKSVAEAKREHNALKMQEEKVALGREVLEMMRGNGGIQ